MTRKTSWMTMAAIGTVVALGSQVQAQPYSPTDELVTGQAAQAQQAQQSAPVAPPTQQLPPASSQAPGTEFYSQETEVTSYSETQTLPDTGGAPLLMSLGGALLAGGGLLLRRKIS